MNRKPNPTTLILFGSLAIILLLIVLMLVTKPNGKDLPEATETPVMVSTLPEGRLTESCASPPRIAV